MNNFETHSELLNKDILLLILELSKIPTAEYIIIPRVLFQESQLSCITGIKSNTVFSINKFDILFQNQFPTEVWKDVSLQFISFSTNQLNPFIRAVVENDIKEIYLNYNKYIVNNQYISIAHSISTNVVIKMKTSQGIVKWTPVIELNPYKELLENIDLLKYKYDNSNLIFENELTDNEEFKEIWDMKSSDGAFLWVPNINKYPIEIKPYMIYLSKIMFSVAKADTVQLTIKNNVPDEIYDKFLTKFRIIKKKKKFFSYHDYYLMGILMI